MEFNETWQESRSKRPLPSLCFSGWSEKQDGRPGPLIGRDIFDFSSETAERNSTKLDRKQDLNAPLPSLCFLGRSENKTAALSSDWLRHFRLLLWNGWTGIQRNLTGSKLSMPSTTFVFSGKSGKNKMAALAYDWLRHFRLLLWNCERNLTKLDRKQDLNALYQVCVFQVDRKNKMAALAYDLLRHFQLFLWNRWIEFNKTWQEARSPHPLPGLRFSGWSEKQDSRPVLWLAETFLTSPMKPLNRNSTKLDRKQVLNVLYQVCVFGLIQKTIWPPWPLIGWDIFWFFVWNRWTEFSETWQEARS